MKANGLKRAHWTRMVQSGYGKDVLLEILRKDHTLIQRHRRSYIFYAYVSLQEKPQISKNELYAYFTPYVSAARKLSAYVGMNPGNKCRLQINETVEVTL